MGTCNAVGNIPIKPELTMSAALFIPFFNFMGVITTRLLITKFQNNETKLVAIFFRNSSIIAYLVLLAICLLSSYGASSTITSVIPLKYRMTSSVAGFLDFQHILDAGLSGIITRISFLINLMENCCAGLGDSRSSRKYMHVQGR